MNTMLRDYLMIDGTEEPQDEFEYFSALQRQINSGLIWRMQGSAGRTAMDAITSGRCLCAFTGCRDYWGSYVPARTEVQPGTKGSYDFVRECSGVEWADMMKAVDEKQEVAA
jgi:hypothetical protein